MFDNIYKVLFFKKISNYGSKEKVLYGDRNQDLSLLLEYSIVQPWINLTFLPKLILVKNQNMFDNIYKVLFLKK